MGWVTCKLLPGRLVPTNKQKCGAINRVAAALESKESRFVRPTSAVGGASLIQLMHQCYYVLARLEYGEITWPSCSAT